MANRLAQNPTMSDDRRQAYNGGTGLLLMDELTAPIDTRKPAVIGVQFMGDLFHEDVPNRSSTRSTLSWLITAA
jgi:protein gp37